MLPADQSQIFSPEAFRAKQAELTAHFTGHWLTDCANFSAFVFHSLPRLNWAGFYFFDGEKLRLGPFQGKPACTEILPGRGVCGTAFQRREILLVPDVQEFPGHITCDSASRSEMVLPFFSGTECLGVFDLDSPAVARFAGFEAEGVALWLQALAAAVAPASWAAKPWRLPRAQGGE